LKKLEQQIRNDLESHRENEDDVVKLVTIPKAAKHASRHHCSLNLHKSSNGQLQLDIEVLGQNGMQLEGSKIPTGMKSIQVTEGETILLGFYTDFEVKVICKNRAKKHVILNNASITRLQQEAEEQSLPPVPTSEATLGLDLEMDLEEDEDEEYAKAESKEVSVPTVNEVYRRASISLPSSVASSPVSVAYKKRQASRESSHQPVAIKRARLSSEVISRSSSPAPSPYAHQDDDGYPPEDSSESEDEEAVERRKEGELIA